MAKFNLKNIEIQGISCAVPKNKIDNTSFYEKFGQKYVDDFIGMTGVKSKYITSEEQTASDLCYVAAKNLIEAKNIDASKIGAVVFVTEHPDYILPSSAYVLHKRLGLSETCAAFDVKLGCSGYVYGLSIAGSLMQSSDIDFALLLVGNTSTKTISPEDKPSTMLFGDSGSATLLVKTTKGGGGLPAN